MGVYNLDSNEAVIMQASNVMVGTSTNRVDLVLTNKNLIQVNKGFFGGDKDSEKYPLSELKIYNGKANVLVGKNKNNSRQLEIYFANCEKFYRFDGLLVENKWVAAIIKAHKQCMDEIAKAQKDASGQGSIFKVIAGSIDSAKEKVMPKKIPSVKMIKCPKCGAELNGQKGETVRCIYCETVTIIK